VTERGSGKRNDRGFVADALHYERVVGALRWSCGGFGNRNLRSAVEAIRTSASSRAREGEGHVNCSLLESLEERETGPGEWHVRKSPPFPMEWRIDRSRKRPKRLAGSLAGTGGIN